MHVLTFLLGGEEPGPAGTRSPFFAPYEAYRTADGYLVVVGTGGRDSWGNLCRTLGVEHLIEDPRFSENADRVANAEELRVELEAVLASRPSAEWIEDLAAVGVACAPVQRLSQVLESEQVRELGMVSELEHPVAGAVPTVRLPVTMTGARTTSDSPPPALDGADGGDTGEG
jgi:formyl-CoA transferase